MSKLLSRQNLFPYQLSNLYPKDMQPHTVVRGQTDETVYPRSLELLWLEAALDFLMSWNQTVKEL